MSWVLLVTPLYVVLPSLYYTPCYIPQPVINPPAFKVFFLKRNCSNRRHRVVIFRTSGRDLTTWRPGLSSSSSFTRHFIYSFSLFLLYFVDWSHGNSRLFIHIYHQLFWTNCARVQCTLSSHFRPSCDAVKFATTERKRKKRDRGNGDSKLFECLPLNLSPAGRKRE